MDTDGYKLYIDGQWINKDETFADYNPATGDTWAEIPNGTREDAGQAVAAAAAAQADWAALPHPQRAGYLLKAADILEKRQKDFVDALIDESGSWIGKSMFESGCPRPVSHGGRRGLPTNGGDSAFRPRQSQYGGSPAPGRRFGDIALEFSVAAFDTRAGLCPGGRQHGRAEAFGGNAGFGRIVDCRAFR